jgi:hypothetical protein
MIGSQITSGHTDILEMNPDEKIRKINLTCTHAIENGNC